MIFTVKPFLARISILSVIAATIFTSSLKGQASDSVLWRSGGRSIVVDSLQRSHASLLAAEYANNLIDPLSYREGMEYDIYFNPTFSTPLLLFKLVSSSTMVMKGRVYEGLILYYDTFLGEVILPDMGRITSAGQPGMIVLNKSLIKRVTFFTLGQQLTLENIQFPKTLKPNLADGFYEVGYNGQCKLYTSYVSTVDLREGKDYYTHAKVHFVLIGSDAYQIKRAPSFYRLLKKEYPTLKKVLKPVRDKYFLSDEVRIVEMLKILDNHISQENN